MDKSAIQFSAISGFLQNLTWLYESILVENKIKNKKQNRDFLL